jgi:hypothetical protein
MRKAMEHRGIKYDIKVAPGRNEWVWVVDTPVPKQGSIKGTRDQAKFAAETYIKGYRRRHPAQRRLIDAVGNSLPKAPPYS